MRKASILVLALAMLMVTSSAFALLDDNSQNSNSAATATTGASTSSATGGNGGTGIGGVGFGGSSSVRDSGNSNNENRNTNTAISSATGGRVESDISNRNSNEIDNRNLQGQLQGQAQGQVANGKVETDVKVEGDNVKAYANAWPSLSAAEGVSSGTASSIFGSLGLSSTESYKKIIPQIQAIIAIDPALMDNDSKKAVIKILVTKMTESNRKQRLLGVGPEVQGKSLINLFGILSWDSVWAEGQNPFQCKSDIK
jgi:hypothetical protein